MKPISKIKHHKKDWIDLTRLSVEFEKTYSKASGKTLHKLIRALQETDLDFNIVYLYKGNLNFYIDYLFKIAEALGFKIRKISQNEIMVDNGYTIKFLNSNNLNRGYNLSNISIIED